MTNWLIDTAKLRILLVSALNKRKQKYIFGAPILSATCATIADKTLKH